MKITDLKSYKVVAQTPTYTELEEEGTKGAEGFAVGVAKSELGLLRGMGQLGQDIAQHTAGYGVKYLTKKLTGKDVNVEDLGTDLYDPESKTGAKAKEFVQPKGGAEKFGKLVGDVAQFALPAGAASKMTMGANLATRAGVDALVAGTVTSMQQGEVNKNSAISAGVSGGLTLAAPVASALFRKATQELPEWLVRPLVKQSKQAKIAGKPDAAKLLVESGRVGSVDKILSKTDEAINALDDKITANLTQATTQGKTIALKNIRRDIADKITLAGGELDDMGVQEVLESIAPQAKGLLKKETLTISEANRLRQLIDRTLGDRAFIANQLPYNKDIAMDFADALRETVKREAPEGTRTAFSELSKNITLRKALLSRAKEAGGRNSVGLYDILTGIGFGAAVNPVAGVAAAGARRAMESATVKTTGAQLLTSLGKMEPALAAMAPTERAIVLSFLQNVFGENPESQTQPTQ